MKVLAVRSIPLSKESSAAWKSTEHNLKFLAPGKNGDVAVEVAEINNYDLILNLGSLTVKESDIVINKPEVVRMLRSSKVVREGVLGGFLPPKAVPGDKAWAKGAGHGGRGKFIINAYDPDRDNNPLYDYQRHVDGQEWRVITVGHKVVQVQKRLDAGDADQKVDQGREYEWVGVEACPRGVKGAARQFAELLPGFNVIGWDIIMNDIGIYLFEGNTSPGVNDATAGRIMKQIAEDCPFLQVKDEEVDERERIAEIYDGFENEPVIERDVANFFVDEPVLDDRVWNINLEEARAQPVEDRPVRNPWDNARIEPLIKQPEAAAVIDIAAPINELIEELYKKVYEEARAQLVRELQRNEV